MVSAYSIGASKRSTEWKNQSAYVPGPGAYNPSKKQKKTSPAWRIGSSMRSNLHKSGAPGPGTYEIPAKITKEGPKYLFGVKFNEITKDKYPGPGTYEEDYRKVVKSLPKYSFGLKSISFSRLNSPGPGAYEANKSSVINVPSSIFGREKRDNSIDKLHSPGVGSYNMAFSDVKGPKFGFGTSLRDYYINKMNPGPGTYELSKSLIDPSHGKTMISRRNDQSFISMKNNPGPSDYNPNKLKSKATIRIGTASRESILNRSFTPGPGSYYPGFIDKPNSSIIGVGSSVRRPMSASNTYPGPGNYEIPSKMVEGPKFLFGNKPEDFETKKKRMSPGPGAYTPDSSIIKERGASPIIGSSQRPDFLNAKGFPGPGQYDIRGGIGGPKWGFGTSIRPDLVTNNDPGPGTYLLHPTFADVPKYLIGTPNKLMV